AYSMPFRARRFEYVRLLTLTWWDGARSVWLFWAGAARLGLVLLGWIWGTLRMGARMIAAFARQLVASPMAALDWTSRRYFQPGVPWLAFLLIIVWSAIEASVFTYTLRPTLTGVLWDLTGSEPNAAIMMPLLFLFLFFLISGSFACIHVLTEAIENRKPKQIIQMVFVEFFVMFFEVMFLYRDLIDAVTPWIAQQTNEEVRLGLWSTLALASFGWIGIRGMTWFLFGRYGTPALLAILSRDTLDVEAAGANAQAEGPAPTQMTTPWREIVQAFKADREWFDRQGKRLVELAVLPVMQVLAAAVNFCVIAVTSRPVFGLPFETLEEAMAKLPSRTQPSLDAEAAAMGGAAAPEVHS
ncbi:MAG: hypothetical protein ACODAE_08070, partial [Gemmatimonadota bacterium]